MDSYRPELETCPYCSSRGNCIIHGYYKRSIAEFRDGSVVWAKVNVMRVRCKSCGHTHAILPDIIIPYSRYGLLFILRVLADHFFHRLSIEKICDRYSVSRMQFCRWLSLWKRQKKLWLGWLCSSETDDCAFMEHITRQTDYSDFSSAFIRRSAMSFLQSHKNPADYCQQVFAP